MSNNDEADSLDMNWFAALFACSLLAFFQHCILAGWLSTCSPPLSVLFLYPPFCLKSTLPLHMTLSCYGFIISLAQLGFVVLGGWNIEFCLYLHLSVIFSWQHLHGSPGAYKWWLGDVILLWNVSSQVGGFFQNFKWEEKHLCAYQEVHKCWLKALKNNFWRELYTDGPSEWNELGMANKNYGAAGLTVFTEYSSG